MASLELGSGLEVFVSMSRRRKLCPVPFPAWGTIIKASSACSGALSVPVCYLGPSAARACPEPTTVLHVYPRALLGTGATHDLTQGRSGVLHGEKSQFGVAQRMTITALQGKRFILLPPTP